MLNVCLEKEKKNERQKKGVKGCAAAKATQKTLNVHGLLQKSNQSRINQ